MSTCQSALSIK